MSGCFPCNGWHTVALLDCCDLEIWSRWLKPKCLAHKPQFHGLRPTMVHYVLPWYTTSYNEVSPCGAVPVETRQGGGEPGPMPQEVQPKILLDTTSGHHPQAWRRNSTVDWGIFGQRLHSSERLGWTSEPGRTTKRNEETWLNRSYTLLIIQTLKDLENTAAEKSPTLRYLPQTPVALTLVSTKHFIQDS